MSPGDPNETQGGGSFLGVAHPAALDQWPELQLPSVDDLDLEGDCGDGDAAVEDRIRDIAHHNPTRATRDFVGVINLHLRRSLEVR